jgi:hypothetical protein
MSAEFADKDGFILRDGRSSLTRSEMSEFLSRVVTRKERNTGVLTHLLRILKRTDTCTYTHGVEVQGVGISRLTVAITLVGQDRYRVFCPGRCVEEALARANRYQLPKAEMKRGKPKKATETVVKFRPPRRMRAQYSHTEITWSQALQAIAYAHRMSARVHELRSQMKEKVRSGNPLFVLKLDGIQMGIELIEPNTRMPDDHTQVRLLCEKKNQHTCYRRLRSKLRDMFHRSDKAKRREKARELKSLRQWRTRQRLLFAVAN